jgi:hypothetical protein
VSAACAYETQHLRESLSLRPLAGQFVKVPEALRLLSRGTKPGKDIEKDKLYKLQINVSIVTENCGALQLFSGEMPKILRILNETFVYSMDFVILPCFSHGKEKKRL